MSSAATTVWYFYKVKWGHQDEFLDLFRRNHYPILREQLGNRFTEVKTWVPKFHGDGRADWTFVVSITFRDLGALLMPSQEKAIARRLFPDQETFRREEQRRFELLEAHWDVLLKETEVDE